MCVCVHVCVHMCVCAHVVCAHADRQVHICIHIHSKCVHLLMRDEKEGRETQLVQLYNVQCTCICTVHLIQEYGVQKISPLGRVVGGSVETRVK